jgi:hypothetical protein
MIQLSRRVSALEQLERWKKVEKSYSLAIPDHLSKKQMFGGEARGEEERSRLVPLD